LLSFLQKIGQFAKSVPQSDDKALRTDASLLQSERSAATKNA